MSNLRAAMDAAFWDQNIPTTKTLDGISRAVPGERIPLDGARASKEFRVQQLSLLRPGFPLGIVPSFSPVANKEKGSIALHTAFSKAIYGDWWAGLVGQLRPKKLISNIKAEIAAVEEWEVPVFKDMAMHLLDKSLYAIGLFSEIPLTSSSSLLLSAEKHDERKWRTKATLIHQLPDHDISLEAAWPELFIDHKGKYWEVPESVSLDCVSLFSESGLGYRFGMHKSSGMPQAVDSTNGEAPLALLPGVSAKAAFSYEKSKDFWRRIETVDDVVVKTERGGLLLHTSYDLRLKEPHAAISGILGGTCEAWFPGGKGSEPADVKNRCRFGADLFASMCYTFQHGKFKEPFGDLTRIDARLDIASASGLAKKVASIFSSQSNQSPNNLSSPKLNLILQQQIAGPIVARVDSQFSLGPGPKVEDVIFSLNYALRLLESGRVVAWYSPKRKEAMIEVRTYDF